MTNPYFQLLFKHAACKIRVSIAIFTALVDHPQPLLRPPIMAETEI